MGCRCNKAKKIDKLRKKQQARLKALKKKARKAKLGG